MSGWDIFMVATVCAGGALLFLRVVAGDIEARSQRLDTFEEKMRRNWQRQQAEQTEFEEPPTFLPPGKTESDAGL